MIYNHINHAVFPLSFQLLVVHIVSEMPAEGSGSRMGAGMLAKDLPASVLSVIPACGPAYGSAHHRRSVLGRSAGRDGTGRQTGRAAVQHRYASGVRVPWRMGVPHAYLARSRRHAPGRHGLQERRSHQHRRPL